MKAVKSNVVGRTTPVQLQVQRTPKSNRKQPSKRCSRRTRTYAALQQTPPQQQSRDARTSQQRRSNLMHEGGPNSVNAAETRTLSPNERGQQSQQMGQSFFGKCKAAYQIFFPPQEPKQTAQEQGRERLRMILVADRCAMSSSRLTDMKSSIVSAVSNYVEVATDDKVEVNVTTDKDMGTIYSVAVPVKRVRPSARFDIQDQLEDEVGLTEWSDDDPEADPSSRFPFGT